MPLQFVSAQASLAGLVFGGADDDAFSGLPHRVAKQMETGGLFQMLDDIAHENEVVTGQLFEQRAGIADVDVVVKKAMHGRKVGGMSFNPVDSDAPVLAPVARRVLLRFVN